MRKARFVLSLSLLLLLAAAPIQADKDIIDFSKRITPVCEVVGLSVKPPKGWFNVPIESADEAISGCQMMRTDRNDQLVGILRLLSIYLPGSDGPDSPEWYDVLLSAETRMISTMGYVLEEVIWRRLDVPISGSGFENARAIGFASSVEGSEVPQEVQFLVFENGPQKYVITLLTPGRSVDGGSYYNRNAGDYSTVIRSLKKRIGTGPGK